MSKRDDPSAPHSRNPLRECAEEQLRAKRSDQKHPRSEPETERILQELQTHQIELEMQNEELRRSRAELDGARARYFDLYDLAPVGYCTLSVEGLILEANLTLAKLLNVARGVLVKQPLTRFIAEDDQDIYYLHRKDIFKILSTSAGQAGEPLACDLRMVKQEGTPFWTHLASTVAQDENGTPVYRVTISDITERKRAEEERRHFEARILHAQKLESLAVLAGGIAHDFNNLLMAILGNADLATRATPQVSPAQGYLRDIETASRRAADLCRQMLAYSGKGRFVVEALDLNRVVEEMKRMLKVSISRKAVLKCNLAANLPAMEADATQARQVLMNLITNASDAIGDKAGIITITTGAMRCDRNYLSKTPLSSGLVDGMYVYVEVADTGCGMAPAVRDKMFDPFFTTKFTGRGLGMAAVLGIVRGHKGAIEVDSEPGKGTTIKVLFPASARTAVRNRVECGYTENWRGTGTILVVDDEEAVRVVLAHMLELMGFKVIVSNDGPAAIEVLRERQAEITCVLLDLTMPQMDGEETFREMRRIDKNVRIIMSSGYDEQDVTQRFVGQDLAGFIQKPFQFEGLQAKMRNVLGA